MKVKLWSRLRMAAMECLVAGAEHLGIRLKLPFIAVRTGEVPIEPAMSAPSEPERDAPLLGFNSKHGRKIRDFGEAGVNALCRDACHPSGRRPGTGPEPFVWSPGHRGDRTCDGARWPGAPAKLTSAWRGLAG